MRRVLAQLILAGVALSCAFAQSQSAAASRWTPALYEGLTMGKARKADMIRLLGAPAKITPNGSTTIFFYEGKGAFNGDVTVELDKRTGVIESVTLGPHPLLTRTTAYKQYGQGYRFVRYAKADCAGMRPESLYYRDAKGDFELIEYPSKGIILWPDHYGYDIASIVYRSKPLPEKRPACGKK